VFIHKLALGPKIGKNRSVCGGLATVEAGTENYRDGSAQVL